MRIVSESYNILKNSNIDDHLNDRIKSISVKRQKDDDKLKEVCCEFEAIFLNQIFKQMRNSIKNMNPSSLLDGGFAEEVFNDMLYDEYSKMASKNSSIGIANIVYNYLKGK